MTFTVAKVKPGHQADAPGVEEEGGGVLPYIGCTGMCRWKGYLDWKGYLAISSGKGI